MQQEQSEAQSSFEYIMAIDCSEAYKDFGLDVQKITFISGMMCPNTTTYRLQMNQQKYSTSQTSFWYVVKPCPAMNEIRASLGLPTV